jgi:hypothetical protein
VSLAESLMLRGAAKPLTFPFKIWGTYKIIILAKRALRQPAEKQQ